jgi:putative endonuclease
MADVYVYIVSNPARTVLYTGVTNDLPRRIIEHYLHRGDKKTFAGRYYCYELVWWEGPFLPMDGIDREKEIKKWSRLKKMALIRRSNPAMRSLNKSVDVRFDADNLFSRGDD